MLEFLEDGGAPVGRNARAGIGDRERNGAAREGDPNPDAAALGEFDGVAGEIDEDLAQTRGIADEKERDPGCHMGRDLDALLLGAGAEQFNDALDHGLDLEGLRLERHLAGFDAREIEHFLDQRRERPARTLDGVEIGHLLGVERGGAEQFGHAENAVQGGADLVAYGGDEARFGPRRGFRAGARLAGRRDLPAVGGPLLLGIANRFGQAPQTRPIQHGPDEQHSSDQGHDPGQGHAPKDVRCKLKHDADIPRASRPQPWGSLYGKDCEWVEGPFQPAGARRSALAR